MDHAVSLLSGLEAKRYATWAVFIAIAYQLKTFYPVILGLDNPIFLHVAPILLYWELRSGSSILGRLFSAMSDVMLCVCFLLYYPSVFVLLPIIPPSNASCPPNFLNFLSMYSPAHYGNADTTSTNETRTTTTHAQTDPFMMMLHL